VLFPGGIEIDINDNNTAEAIISASPSPFPEEFQKAFGEFAENNNLTVVEHEQYKSICLVRG
jgi:hypothetical protein